MTDGPHVLVVASTFPASTDDSVPRFVYDQVVALKGARPNWRFTVLAPHSTHERDGGQTEHSDFTEVRFHYLLRAPRLGVTRRSRDRARHPQIPGASSWRFRPSSGPSSVHFIEPSHAIDPTSFTHTGSRLKP